MLSSPKNVSWLTNKLEMLHVMQSQGLALTNWGGGVSCKQDVSCIVDCNVFGYTRDWGGGWVDSFNLQTNQGKCYTSLENFLNLFRCKIWNCCQGIVGPFEISSLSRSFKSSHKQIP